MKIINQDNKISVYAKVGIAVVPIIAYFMTFIYQYGKINYYNLPPNYISLNLNTAFATFLSLFIFLELSFLILVWAINYFSEKKKSSYLFSTICVVPLVLPLLLKIYLVGFHIENLLPALIWRIAIVVIVFYITFKINLEKINLSTIKVFGVSFLTLILIVSLPQISSVLYSFGKLSSSKQEYYYIVESEPQKIIISFYDDKAITASINEIKNSIKNGFEVVNVSDLGKIVLKKIGPLQAQEP